MDVKALGSKVGIPEEYDSSVLERVPAPNAEFDDEVMESTLVKLLCTEFTSLCPVTGQPDFAKIEINYIPDEWLVESKSLKLYLGSFRNHGGFHEQCVSDICTELFRLLEPCYIDVTGYFTVRGGIAIWPFAQAAQEGWEDVGLQRALANMNKGGMHIKIE